VGQRSWCRRAGAALVCTVLLAACASPSAGAGGSSPGPSALTRLQVTVDAGNGAAAVTWTLSCDPPAGTHPHPPAACTQLAAAPTDPFAPTPPGMMCSMIYGGSQTATVSGTFHGRPVATTFARTNGCQVARWQRVSALLAIPVGAG
jgi:hypothetical protein